MTSASRYRLSQRGFCLCCVAAAPAFAAGGGWITPRESFAEALGIVELIKSETAFIP